MSCIARDTHRGAAISPIHLNNSSSTSYPTPGEALMPIHDNAAVSFGNDCLKARQQQSIPWLWDGLIAEDAITLLSGPEKAGKTTLLSLLLDRRRDGGQ